MKTALRFRRGAGAIFAFVILFAVFASVAGVVFLAVNSPSLKPSAASYSTCDFNRDGAVDKADLDVLGGVFGSLKAEDLAAYDVDTNGAINSVDMFIVSQNSERFCRMAGDGHPYAASVAELSCSGTWKTIKTLGRSSPDAIAANSGKLIMVDESPQLSSSQQLVAREISINDGNGQISSDTDWYEVGFKNTQASMGLSTAANGVTQIWLYGDVNDKRMVYDLQWISEKKWSKFRKTQFENVGATGPRTVLLGNRMYRVVSAYLGTTESTAGYLQQCEQTLSRAACNFSPDRVKAGEQIVVVSEGGLSGAVTLSGGGGVVQLGTVTSNTSGALTIPATAIPGTYAVRVGNATSATTCITYEGATNLTIADAHNTILGNKCDFNRDGILNSGDQGLMAGSYGKIVPGTAGVIYDLNGDKTVNSGDAGILAQAIRIFPSTTKYCY